MKNSLTFFLLSALSASPAAWADSTDMETLLARMRCVACHDVRAPLLGPAYTAIAARHAAADRDVMIHVLAQKIVMGGGGNWGVVPMVANEHVNLDDARRMAEWILDLAQDSE